MPAHKTMRDIDRVLRRLDVSDCWEWKLCVDKNGYGITHAGSSTDGSLKTVKVHRFVYQQMVGPIPEGMDIDHLCVNRKCANPDHLRPLAKPDHGRLSPGGMINKRKTHCPSGHSYSEFGYTERNSGCRKCKVCSNARRKARYIRTRDAKRERLAA